MKKRLLLLMMTVGALALHAETYPYLTFTTTDGTKTSLSSTDLSMVISGSSLVVTSGSTSKTFALTNLSSMHFSTSSESSTTGINSVDDAAGQPVEVMTIDGRHMGTYSTIAEATASLPKVIYVIRPKTAGNDTIKLKIEN